MVILHKSVSSTRPIFNISNLYSVVAAICAPIYVIYLPSSKPEESDEGTFQKFKGIDWTGVFLSVGLICTFAIVLTFAGTTWNWNDGRTIAMFVVLG